MDAKFIKNWFLGSLISFSTNSLLAADHDREADYGYSSSGESTVVPAMNHAERYARHYTAELSVAAPDIYLHVPGSGMIFSIADYTGSAKVLRKAYRKFISTVQSAQNVALIVAEGSAGADDMVRAPSVASVATTVAPSGWDNLPEDLHAFFDDEVNAAASASGRRTIAASGHDKLMHALSEAAVPDSTVVSTSGASCSTEVPESKMSEVAGARTRCAKRIKKRRPNIEAFTIAQLLAYKFDSSDDEDGHARLPKLAR